MIIGKTPIQRRGKHHIADIKSRAIDLWMDKEYDGPLEDYVALALKEHRLSLFRVEDEQQPEAEGIWSKDSMGWYRVDR
jgi:hypothetical protein